MPGLTYKEVLQKQQRLVYTGQGTSMLPMLHSERDVLIIEKPEGRLKKYDIALFRYGGKYILHRVIRVYDDGYIFRGDNTYVLEKAADHDVIGILTGFTRKGKLYSVKDVRYRLYARIWCAVYPVRYGLHRLAICAKTLARKNGITLWIKRLIKHE